MDDADDRGTGTPDVLNSDTEHSTDVEQAWDDLEDEDKHALLSLAEKLKVDDPKQAAKNAVSRRAFLGAGATVGAGLLGAAAGRASAGSQSAGTIGTEANPADFWSEDNYIKSQSGSPSSPSSSGDIVFFNDSGTLKQKDSSGTVTNFGGAGSLSGLTIDADKDWQGYDIYGQAHEILPGDDWQTVLNTAENADSRRSTLVRARPQFGTGDYYQLSGTTSPITVPAGVTLDIRGTWINYTSAFNQIFDLRPSAKILGHGARIRTTNGNADSSIFQLNGDTAAHSSRDNTAIYGYPRIQTTTARALHLVQTGGGSVAGTRAELTAWNSDDIVKFESGGSGGYVNANRVEVMGTAEAGDCFTFEYTAGSEVTLNVVSIDQLNILANVNRVAYFNGGQVKKNVVRGTMFDVANATTPWEWAASCGANNKVVRRNDTVASGTNNSGDATNEAIADMAL